MENTRKGFTLIEVMITTVISSIIIFGAFTILQVSNKQLDAIHAKMSLEESSRAALFKMAQEIRQTSPDPGKLHNTFSAPDAHGMEYAVGLDFEVPVPSPNAASLVDANYDPKWADNIQYSLDANTHQILRTATDETTHVVTQAILANDITDLAFSRKNTTPELITITVSAQKELADGRWVPEAPIQTTMQAEARNP